MARILSYTFPAGNTQDVCLTQTAAGAGNLLLNGYLTNPTYSKVSFINNGYSRQISITSTNNLSARNFTVTGMQNGVSITEVIAGPNNTTVYSLQLYDVITSIAVNGAAAAVSIGSGWKGTIAVSINLQRAVINYTLTSAKTTAASVQTAIYGTIDDINNNGVTYLGSIASNNSLFPIKAMAATDQYVYSNVANDGAAPAGLNPIYSTLLILLGNSSATVANAMKINYIQT